MQLPGHLHRAQDLVGFTLARVGSFLSQRLRISCGHWQVEDAQTTPTTIAEGDLRAPRSGQLDLTHCPATTTQRSFPWPHWSIWAQWFTREPQFASFCMSNAPTFHKRSNAPVTRSLAVAQFQIQSIRPRVPQTSVLDLYPPLLSNGVRRPFDATIMTTSTSPFPLQTWRTCHLHIQLALSTSFGSVPRPWILVIDPCDVPSDLEHLHELVGTHTRHSD